MKVIFLDIDGVLNTTRSAVANRANSLLGYSRRHLDPVGAGMIRDVCLTLQVKLVISSTWRLGGLNKTGSDLDTLLYRELLTANLFDLLHEDWRTKVSERRWRGDEVKEWLSRHPEVQKFAIIDDDSDFHPEQMPFFIKVKADDGILANHYRKLKAIFA